MSPAEAIYVPWVVWMVSWFAAAAWADRTVNRPSRFAEWAYRIPEIGGFVLLLTYVVRRGVDGGYHTTMGGSVPVEPLWVLPINLQWAMVGLAAFGFLFCWWARIHLGRLWSGNVTRKEGHRVIDTGPYAIVRHPIYTGVITASIATAAIRGTPAALLGVALIVLGYLMKGRLEERFLRAELGAEAYDAYARRTAMLVPFVKL
jgi:protein-S-isoprenylcysteine O-methyltransferase Ste14